MKAKTVLIAGGAGFIGSHLCDHYLSKGYRVIALDNLSTGKMANISHLKDNPEFVFIYHDIVNHIKVKEDIDLIINMASPASPPKYLSLPIPTLKAGSIGAINILDLAVRKNATIFMASTSEIYGDPLVHPQHESYYGNVNPIGERSVYDEAKRFQESITMAYYKRYDLDIRIARIFNTYGPRMDINDGRLLPNLFRQLLTDEPFTVYGSGIQTRSLIYISDLVVAIDKLIESGYNYPMNLGSEDELTVNQIVENVLKISNKNNHPIIKMPLPENDPLKRRPDIGKAKTYLKWNPSVNLSDGLKSTLSYFKSELSKSSINTQK